MRSIDGSLSLYIMLVVRTMGLLALTSFHCGADVELAPYHTQLEVDAHHQIEMDPWHVLVESLLLHLPSHGT